VAAPVSWEELEAIENPRVFTIADAATLRKRSRSKALRGWGLAEQAL
jgi:bifunctional non-homologous end joining protein LigD